MHVLAVYALLVLTPAAAFSAGWLLLRRWTAPRSRSGPAVAGRPVERLVADLRRLEAEYRRTELDEQPSRSARLRAIRLAYDDVLRQCCATVGLPVPSRPPWPALLRLETEAALARAGLVW